MSRWRSRNFRNQRPSSASASNAAPAVASSFPGTPGSTLGSVGRARLQQWHLAARRIAHAIETRTMLYQSHPSSHLGFSLTHVGEDGLMAGNFSQPESPFETNGQLYLRLPLSSNTLECDCTCGSFRKHEGCTHVTNFVRLLCEQLSVPNTEVAKRIVNEDFDTDSFNIKRFQASRSTSTLTRLNNLLSQETIAEHNELPDIEDVAPTRLAWNIVPQSNPFHIQIMHQRQKKRGNGWLKGRKVTPADLYADPKLVASERDRAALRCFKRKSAQSYYTPTYDIDYFALISCLIDHPAVTLAGEPVELSLSEFQMVFHASDEFGILAPKPPFKATSQTVHYVLENCLVFVDTSTIKLAAISCTSEQLQFIRSTQESPVVIEQSKFAEHLPLLKQLAEKLPLILPEDFAGKQQDDVVRPVMLLRSRSSGELDFGLRVRDAMGRLFRPCHGPAVYQEIKGDAKIQWCRKFGAERARIFELADQLGIREQIDPNQFNGVIDDFRTGIDLIETLENLKDEIEVCWDRRTERRPTMLGTVTASNLRVQLSTKRDWFGLEGSCKFADSSIELADLLAALTANNQDAELDGEFVQVAPDQWARISLKLQQRLRRLADHSHSERGSLKIDRTGVASVEALADEQIQIDAPKKWSETVARLRQAENLNPLVPKELNADLRSYQEEGFAWMRRLAEWGVGGVLADDMGLGKTVQTLAVLLDRKSAGPALVIAPTSVGFNWAREAERFAPGLKAHLYRDTDRGDLLEKVGPGDVVILSYGLALRDEKQLAKVNWSTMVLDEAQAVKNSRSKTTKAVSSISADWKIALTGTPVENHLGELWSIFRVVSPGLLGGWEQFRNKFASPIEKDNCPKRRQALSQVLQPFILRRTKSSVLTELPERTESNLYVDLSKEERTRYESWRMAAIGEIDGIESLTTTNDARFQILAVLTRLRQLACNVGLVDKEWQGESSKLNLLLETMEELRSEGHRALVFSQFTEHLAKIKQAFDAAGISYQYLDGSTPAKTRGELVDRFQAGAGDAFLISLKAGGTGLNLTAADYVIHMDPWWNPAVEDQATDRAHRIGQQRPVMVYRIVAKGTIEEEILRLHETKRDLVAGILDGTSAAAKLSTAELMQLIRSGGN